MDKSLGTVVQFERFLTHAKFISACYLHCTSPPHGQCWNRQGTIFDLLTLYWVGKGEGLWIFKMIALPLRTVLVIHIELLLCSYCPKDFCPGLQTPLFASSISHLHISCNTPCLHPPNFLISPECYSCPKRNWRRCIYRMFGGQTRCITGDVQMAIGTQSRLWGLAAIVGVEEKGVISKGTGRCSALSFATWVKKTLSDILVPLCHAVKRAWQLHFFITFATPMSEK